MVVDAGGAGGQIEVKHDPLAEHLQNTSGDMARPVKKGQGDRVCEKDGITEFLKFEDVHGRYRPSFVEYSAFPRINLDGAISGVFSAARKKQEKQSDKRLIFTKKAEKEQYCECCDVTTKNLSSHLNGFQHKMFVLTTSNYTSLDSLISSMSVDALLDDVLNTDSHSVAPPQADDPLVLNQRTAKAVKLVDYSVTGSAAMDCNVNCTMFLSVHAPQSISYHIL